MLYSGLIDCFHKIYANEGIVKGFYAGLSAPIVGSACELATTFFFNGKIKEFLHDWNAQQVEQHSLPTEQYPLIGKMENHLTHKQIFLAGAFTGIFISIVLTPVELVKCRMQVQARRLDLLKKQGGSYNGPIYKSTLHCFTSSVKDNGLRGMYRGLLFTFLRDIPGNAMWFGCYDLCRKYLAKRAGKKVEECGVLHQMISGGCAGLAYWIIGLPADTLKSVVQTQVLTPENKKVKLLNVVKYVGVKNLFRGLTPALIRAVPTNAVIFASYEMFFNLINNMGNAVYRLK